MHREGVDRLDAVVVDDDDLARLNVAHELGLNQVKRARLAREHIRAVEFADGERPEAVRVAHADQLVLGHDNQRIGALNPLQTLHEIVVTAVGRPGHQVQNNFTINGGLKNRSAQLQLLAKLRCVGEVAVVRDGDLPLAAVHRQRLGVAVVRRAGRGVARVADRHVALESLERLALEHLRHEAHSLVYAKLPVRAGDDARAFLPAMLQRVQSVVGQLRRVRVAVNTEDAAIVPGMCFAHCSMARAMVFHHMSWSSFNSHEK